MYVKTTEALTGDFGELSFLLEATARGYVVSKPFGSAEGYDFILDNKQKLFRVQVKASNIRIRKDTSKHVNRPCFNLRFKNDNAFDVLVMFDIQNKDFYLMNISEIKSKTIEVSPTSKHNVYKDNWVIFKPNK